MDEDFIKRAASAGKWEVESSRLALSQQSPGTVIELAQVIIRDHTQANQRLMELAESKAVEVPDEMMPEHMTMLGQLQQVQGEQFFRTYEQMQLQAHQEAIDLFQRCAQYCQDPQVREYAASTLPTLQAHLDHVQEAQASLNP
jgi:putative membrane protein